MNRIGIGTALAVMALGACASTTSEGAKPTAAAAGQVKQEPAVYVDDPGTDAPRGAGADDRRAAEMAASTRPLAGAGTQNPHPLPTETRSGSDVRYGADVQARQGQSVEQPGLQGRDAAARSDVAHGAETFGASGSTGAAGSAGASSGAVAMPGGGNGSDAAASRRHQLLFVSGERYDVHGKLAAVSADKGEITIQRENLPPALLKIEGQTRIQQDGQQANLADLRPGSDIRASFNLSGRRPIALEVNAVHAGK